VAKVRSWAGLDVHARGVPAVWMDASTGEIRRQHVAADTSRVVEFVAGLPGPTRVGYEARASRGRTARSMAPSLSVNNSPFPTNASRECGGLPTRERRAVAQPSGPPPPQPSHPGARTTQTGAALDTNTSI
jgi:hypothetical protein